MAIYPDPSFPHHSATALSATALSSMTLSATASSPLQAKFADHVNEMEALMPGDLIEGMEWQARALCAQTDPEAFFPEKGGSTREAKRVCLSCEVRVDCLEYALANDERFGIWGGLSERERRRLKKQAV